MRTMENARPRLCVETSIISYLTARPTRDLVTQAHQQLTHEWWDEKRMEFEFFVSELVIEEAERGDPEAAKRRLDCIANCPILPITPEASELAEWLIRAVPLPERAGADALHLAVAAFHGMEYFLTWNCRHLANGFVRHRLTQVEPERGLTTPTICTPEELYDEDKDMD